MLLMNYHIDPCLSAARLAELKQLVALQKVTYAWELVAFSAEADSQFHVEQVFRQRVEQVVVQGQVLHLVVVVLNHLQEVEGCAVQLKGGQG